MRSSTQFILEFTLETYKVEVNHGDRAGEHSGLSTPTVLFWATFVALLGSVQLVGYKFDTL